MGTEARTREGASRHVEKLVSKFGGLLRRSGGSLVDHFGEETAAVMRGEMLEEYRRLIPEIPYIGGRRNIYSHDLPFSAMALATYRVVVRHGGSLEDASELLHWMVREQFNRIPRVVRLWMGKHRFGRLRRQKLQRATKDAVTPASWPPGFVERTCGEPQTEERTTVS